MSEESIKDKLNQPGLIEIFQGETVKSFWELDSKSYKAKYITFEGCIFSNLLSCENVNFNIGISFKNSSFENGVLFKNIKSEGEDLIVNPDINTIEFVNCVFSEQVLFEGDKWEIQGSLVFKDCTFKKGIEIESISINNGRLYIRNCNVETLFGISKVSMKEELLLSKNTINCRAKLYNISCENLFFFEENDFSESLYISNCLINTMVLFNEQTFKKNVHIKVHQESNAGIRWRACSFKQAVVIECKCDPEKFNRRISLIDLADCKFENGIYIDGSPDDMLANMPLIERINLDISADLKGDIAFRNCDVGVLSMGGYNSSANIQFQRVHFLQVRIGHLINDSGLIFANVRASRSKWPEENYPNKMKSKILLMDNSNLGKAQFFQTDFASFTTVILHNVILTDISTSLVKWFTPEQLEREDESNSLMRLKHYKKGKDKAIVENETQSLISNFNSKREIYRQLKLASQKQGDIPQSLGFQRQEMNYYRKIIKYQKPTKINEYLILWSNQSNDFGQNWIRAFGLLLIFSFIAYIPIGFLNSDDLDYNKFARSCDDISFNLELVLCDNIRNWLTILNPAHRVDEINKDVAKMSTWIYVWDLLSRIVMSYFIFQLVSAFRKFNK